MHDIQALKNLHCACPKATPTELVDQAIATIHDLNDRFLPAHTREHALGALDLLRVVREELTTSNVDDAPCRLRENT